ncbi:MAG: HD domain-containing protein [Chloroflexi bacterium CFX2]|nr:HD domain-containing protein [Chloroflexi bacterium CFX2]
MTDLIRILYVDDSPLDRDLVLDALEKEHGGFKVTQAVSRVDFETIFNNDVFDLVLSDFNILGYEGLQVIDSVHAKDANLPVIIVTGTGSEEIAVEAMKHGAMDYVIKSPKHIRRLPLAIQSALEKKELERKHQEVFDALQRSEKQYRSLFEDSPISFWVEDFSKVKQLLNEIGQEGMSDISQYLERHPEFVRQCATQVRIVDVNSAALKLYGARHKNELLGNLLNVLPDLPLNQFQKELIHIASGKSSFEWEEVDYTLAGEKIHVNLRWMVAPGYEDTLSRVIVSTIDITERQHAEEKIRRQIEYLTALREIDLAIASAFDMRMSLNVLVSRAVSILKVDAVAILLIDPVLSTLEYAAGLGFGTEAVKTARVRLGESFAGKAALERRIVHISDLSQESDNPFLTGFLKDENFNSYYGIPLIGKGKVIGVLEVFHRSKVNRDQEWLDFLSTLAGQAAIAIDNAKLFENLQVSNTELHLAYEATIEGWSRALDLRDKETEGHTLRVTEKTLELARRMGLSENELIHIRRGALLHDIGKMGVPDQILLKPDSLTAGEWEIMRMHPIYAYKLLSPIRYLKSAALDIPYCHHEKWDGSGYPRGLKGEQIPLSARIFAVVDVYDALTSDRPYRPGWTKERVLEYIQSLSGSHFDPDVVLEFLKLSL